MASGDHYFSPAPESELKLRPFTVAPRRADRRTDHGQRDLQPGARRHGHASAARPCPLRAARRPSSRPRLRLGAARSHTCSRIPSRDGLGRRRQQPSAGSGAPERAEARPHQCQRRDARRCSRPTCSSRPIWSNPPIRVGKNELHDLLEHWLPRLEPGSDAWLVVQRNLGSDSLHRWMQTTFAGPHDDARGHGKGYRVLRARRAAGLNPRRIAPVRPPALRRVRGCP